MSFGAKTPHDLLDRAAFEVRKLEEASRASYSTVEEATAHVSSLAVTCVETLWNLVDWLAHSDDLAVQSALANAALRTKEAIRDYVKAHCSALALCHEITNGAKHFALEGYLANNRQVDDTGLSVLTTTPHEAISNCRVVPKITTKTQKLHAIKVYNEALLYWQQFFAQLGL